VYNREGCVSGIEKTLVQDFIDFLTIYHPQLMPYDSLKECRGNEVAYKKYLINILEELSLGEVFAEVDPHFHIEDPEVKKFVQRICLKVDKNEENLKVFCYPADTTGQAKEFYKLIDENIINRMEEKGWSLDTVLHFSYMGTQLVYAANDNEGTKDPLSYIKYWKKAHENGEIRQFKEKEFADLVEKLIEEKMISRLEEEKIQKEFVDTNRDHINLAPGVKFSYDIPLEKAIKWDEEDKLVSKIKKRCDDIFNLR